MTKIGRNEPCPCGSGRKYKKCCLTTTGGAPYTMGDRQAAIQRLLDSMDPDDVEEVRDLFWGELLPLREQLEGDILLEMAEQVFLWWLFFDFDLLDNGETLVDFMLAHERDLPIGERRFLEMGRASSMRLYEVIAVEPGASVTLRDVLEGSEVRVCERSGSRALRAWDLIAARVMARGASGEPEIDGGLLPLNRRRREHLVECLEKIRRELDGTELRLTQTRVLFSAWITPGVPKLVNYDGETLLFTKVHFEVLDERALIDALDGAPDIVRDGEAHRWTWVDKGSQRNETVSLAVMRLDRDRLAIQTNSRERGARAKPLIERLAGAAVIYRVTEYEDVEKAVHEATRSGHHEPAALPKELVEPAREAVEQLLQQHYEKWLDEPVPALDGETPRRAAAIEALRPRVAALIEELERMYERALEEGSGAFDPTWMWEELGLEDLARGRSRKETAPGRHSHPAPLGVQVLPWARPHDREDGDTPALPCPRNVND